MTSAFFLLPLALLLLGSRRSGGGSPLASSVGVPFATGDRRPMWPVVTAEPRAGEVAYRDLVGEVHGRASRRFGADRNGRKHAGIDLFAYADDIVVAAEAGTVVSIYELFHEGWALVIEGDSGLVVLYGELERGSWREFGVERGSHVAKGQPIGRIAVLSGGSSMLHFETYVSGTTSNKRWYDTPPQGLLDPTDYLLRAARNFHPSMTSTS